jgi:hypothetical protein
VSGQKYWIAAAFIFIARAGRSLSGLKVNAAIILANCYVFEYSIILVFNIYSFDFVINQFST